MKNNKAIPQSSLEWMPKSVWGPLKWRELHCRALAYLSMDDEEEWLDSFLKSIPCPLCQGHFNLYMEKDPPDFSSRSAFFRWTVRIHNAVNLSKGKHTITDEEAYYSCVQMILNN